MGNTRATLYRQRAEAIDPDAEGLSVEDRAHAVREKNALNLLADIEEWLAIEPHTPSNYDYKLKPKIRKTAAIRTRKGKPGRRIDPKHINTMMRGLICP